MNSKLNEILSPIALHSMTARTPNNPGHEEYLTSNAPFSVTVSDTIVLHNWETGWHFEIFDSIVAIEVTEKGETVVITEECEYYFTTYKEKNMPASDLVKKAYSLYKEIRYRQRNGISWEHLYNNLGDLEYKSTNRKEAEEIAYMLDILIR